MNDHRPAPARSLGQALDNSATLAGLLAGHARAQACYARAAPLLPVGLRAEVRPGPIDAGAWTLFATNGSAAAKLRQALPALLAAVQVHDAAVLEIRIKIMPRAPG